MEISKKNHKGRPYRRYGKEDHIEGMERKTIEFMEDHIEGMEISIYSHYEKP